jgi:membrane associated rhomboid family serine protease
VNYGCYRRAPLMAVCYRHPDRETGVSCSNCGKPICPDCMTATPVGMRCPDCARQKTPVRTIRNMHADPTVTYALIAICALTWLGVALSGGSGSKVYQDFALLGGARDFPSLNTIGVAGGEYWRLVTGGFLHDPRNPLHILFNMYVLYWLGTMLEPALGHVRFAALYFASLLCGSFGALLLTEPNRGTVGASGAVFGLMGAAFVLQRRAGINPWQSGIGMVIVLNLGLSLLIPGISIGGHLGGLVGGSLCALAMDRVGRVSALSRSSAAPVLVCTVVAIIAVVGSIIVADKKAADIGLAVVGLLT